MSDETPATPYGPADPAPAPAPAPATDAVVPAPPPDVVDRARARMRTTARVLGLTSIGLLLAFVVLVGIEQATGPVADITEPIAGILGVGSPLLAIIALNILVWRALTPRLVMLSSGVRFAAILGIVAVLAVLSIVLLAGLLLAGVLAILTLEGFS